ncbi:MAG: hypothetical protein Q4D51_05450 [Eubacteriales bacterium]|nr:hypothetical protein [Eubacteriales bacterium]
MKNIMKMTIYEFFKKSLSRTIYICAFVSLCLILLVNHYFEPDQTFLDILAGTDDGTFIVTSMIVSVAVMCVIVAQMCGSDFQDKTIHYDLMFGHSRKQVYFGRVFAGMLVGTIGTTVMIVVPFILACFLYKIDAGILWSGILVRAILLMIIIIRMACELILIIFLLKNVQMAGIIYIGMLGGISYMCNTIGDVNAYMFGITNIEEVLTIVNWSTYTLHGKTVNVMQYMPAADMIFHTLVVNIVLGGICIMLGYFVFCKDDLR